MTSRKVLWIAAIALTCAAGAPARAASSADKVPDLDMLPGCQGAASQDLDLADNKPTLESCLKEEQAAREQLVKIWTTFPEATRSDCTAANTTGGPASYINLLWCLKDAQTAQQLEKENPSLNAIAK